ncbi:MAG TPA: phenylacetate-CoA oxygenase/reductase subunit PaaK [Saprospiraceae bacterium]|nr:phenylacetate-CoA oxygenase/reductase subunit PaaK [Saprospiraceae bacterium]
MSVHFHTLRVQEVRRETADTVSVSFEVPAALQETFRFTQGQYLTVRTQIGGEELRRSYSICMAPHERDLRIAVKQVEGGLFSTWANTQLRAGDTLEVMPPQGRFFAPLQADHAHTYVAFAAGSGITPVIALLKATLAQEPKSRFVLFYSNRGFDHIIFREQLEALKSLHPDRLAIHHVLSRESLGSPLFYGRLNAEKCRQYGRYFFQAEEVAAFFLCGPEDMVLEIKACLTELGADAKRIHLELFTTNGVKARSSSPAAAQHNRFDASVTVIQDGTEFEFVLPSDGSSLLDAAMRAGADLPFSCKGGVCCTCKAKLLEGEVHMDVNYGLEPDEVEAGYVLTCQSHPKTNRLVVSFDA